MIIIVWFDKKFNSEFNKLLEDKIIEKIKNVKKLFFVIILTNELIIYQTI